MRNVKVEVAKAEVVIRIPLTAETFRDAVPSSTGKTKVLASTQGNQTFQTPLGSITLGLNLYTK